MSSRKAYTKEEDQLIMEYVQHRQHLQPKTKVVGKVCKTLKNDTTFRFQLNLRGTQHFL